MAGAAGEQSCYPGCDPAADGCPGGYYCGEVVTESGATINRCLSDFRCSDERPFDGDCPRGQVCEAGECVDFLCETPGALEPNESEAEQATVEGTIEGLQICADDEDWFVFQPAAADVVHQIGVASFYGSGDLDVELRNVAGEVVEEAWLRPDDYHEENGRGPIEYEGFAMVGSGQADPFTLRVFGVGGATNNYDLVYEQLPWIDGPSCPGAGFTEAECTAVEGGRFNVDQLVMFPMGHDDDPYIGDGVFFRSGLSYGGYRYIPSSVLWGRRDLVMALRYAIHTVQEEFPGTQPLGIGELGMPDGTTCAGHPNFTHHYGGNVDVSYYIVDGAQREWGNMCYRHICNDTDSLLDWSCVDTDGSAGQFGECITGCGEGHIVDIPRTARFMAAVAESGRLRVWGADTIVDAELDAELGRLASEGVAGAADARMRMATANDHNSWVWHFNHLHISFD
jgi:hypothetical protein